MSTTINESASLQDDPHTPKTGTALIQLISPGVGSSGVYPAEVLEAAAASKVNDMTDRTCTIDDCGKPVKARGWCAPHYRRWAEYGDPLHVYVRPVRLCTVDGCTEPHSCKGMCKRHYMSARYAADRERFQVKNAAYQAAHPGRSAEVSRAWREANPERARANRDSYLARNSDRLKAARRAYREANRDLIRALNNRRKARLRNVTINDLTSQQWRAIVESYRARCVYCGTAPDLITMDHVVPIAHGGNHTASNVVPACGPCNSSKSDGPAPPFVIDPE